MLRMQAAGSEAFREALAPTIGALRDLADAVSEQAGRHGHQPSASSRAMEEVAVEAQFAARSDGWREPIRDTHSFGGMTLTAAADFARSFAVLLDADSTPVYGHLVVARSGGDLRDRLQRDRDLAVDPTLAEGRALPPARRQRAA